MGSRFLTKREAAQILGCTVRNIYRKVSRGELRPVKQGIYVGVWEEDVIALRDSQRATEGENALPFAINRQTLLRLDTELRVLRKELDQVLRVLNIRREPLKVSDLEVQTLYTMAEMYSIKGWPPQVEETWANYLLRFSTSHFEQLRRITKDNHPWRPFLRLANTMALRPYNMELVLQLTAAREHVQTMVSIWFEIHRIPIRQLDAMLIREAAPKKRVLGVMERRQAKFTAKDEDTTA